jgi:hypothetical protein
MNTIYCINIYTDMQLQDAVFFKVYILKTKSVYNVAKYTVTLCGQGAEENI